MPNNSETSNTFLKEFEIATSNKECSLSKLNNFQKTLLNIIQSSNFGDFGNCFSKYCDYIMNLVSDDRINHKEQFEICEESFRIVKDGIFGDQSLCTKFVKEVIGKIFNIVIEENPGIWIVKKEILKILNICQQTLKKIERAEILQTLPKFYIFKLMDTLSTLSDFEFQVNLIEAMFRIYGKKAINLKLKDLIPESEELSQIFSEINPGTFDEDVRSFLNILNKTHNKIYSVLSCNIKMGNFLCKYPMDSIEGIWVDFNLCDRIISWSCIQETFMEEYSKNEDELPWVFISLMSTDVENFTIMSFEGQQSTLVTFKLKSSCICSNEEVCDKVEKIKNIVFYFKDTPQLHHIIADIFPLWFPKVSTKPVKRTKSLGEANNHPFSYSNQIKISKSEKKVGLNETGVLGGVIEPASVKSQTTRTSNFLNDSHSKIQSTAHETEIEEVISLSSSLSSELSAVEGDIESIKILSGRAAETSASFFQQNNRISSLPDVVSRDASSQKSHIAENVRSKVSNIPPSENTKGTAKEISNDVVRRSVSKSLNEVQQLNMPIQSSVLVENKVTEFEEKTQDILTSAIIVLSDDESEPLLQQLVGVKAQKTRQVAKSSTSIRNEQDKKNKDDTSQGRKTKERDNVRGDSNNSELLASLTKRSVSTINQHVDNISTINEVPRARNSSMITASNEVIKSSRPISSNELHELGRAEKNEGLSRLISSSQQIKNKVDESKELTSDILTSPNIVLSDDESETTNSKRIVKRKISTNIEQQFVGGEAQEAQQENMEDRNEKPSSKIKCSLNKNNGTQEVGDSKMNEVRQQNVKQGVGKFSRKKEMLDETKTEKSNNKISFSDQSKISLSKKEHIREISPEDSEKENQKKYLRSKSSTSKKSLKELEFEQFTMKKRKNVKRMINERKRIIPGDDSTDDEIRKEECHKILNISTLANKKQIESNFDEESSRESSYSADLNDTNKDNNNSPNKTNEFPESSEDAVISSKTMEEGKQIEVNVAAENKDTRHENLKIVILSDIKLKSNERLEPKRVDGSECSTEKSYSSKLEPHFVGSKNTIQQHGEKEAKNQAGQVEDNNNKLLKLLDGEDTSDEEIFSTWNTFTRLQGERLAKISEISEAESKKSIQPPKADIHFKELTIPLQRCCFGQILEKESTERKGIQESIVKFNQIIVPITEEESQKSETISQIEKEIRNFVQKTKQDKLIQDTTEINTFKSQEYDADSDNYTSYGEFRPNSENGPKPIINPETAFDKLMKEDVSKKTVYNQEHENQIIVTKEAELNRHQPERAESKKSIQPPKADIHFKELTIPLQRCCLKKLMSFGQLPEKEVLNKEINEVTYDLGKKTETKLRKKYQISQKNEDQLIAGEVIEKVTDQAFKTKQEQCTTDALEYQRVELKRKKTKTSIKDRQEDITIETVEDAKKYPKDHDIDENGNKISQRTGVDSRQKEIQIVGQALHETSQHSKKVVTFDQTTINEEQKTAKNDELGSWKKPELNLSLITTISNRSVRRKRLLYDPNEPVEQFILNNTSIQNKTFTTSSKHNKTVSVSSKFDEISVAEPTDQNDNETESIFVEQTDQNDKEVGILSTQKLKEDEAIPSETVSEGHSTEMRRPARRNTNKNKANSKPERIRKTKANKTNNIVSKSSSFDNNQKKRSDLKLAFEDMLDSFRSDLGGRTLSEEIEIKKIQMSTSLFENRKKENKYKRRVTKRNCLVCLGTPTLSKRKHSDKSLRDDAKKDKAKSLKKSNRTSNKNMNESFENDFRKFNAANRRKRLLESTRFDENVSNFNDLDEETLEPSPNKKRIFVDAGEDLCSFPVTVSDSAPAWHGTAVKYDKFVEIKSEDFLGKYLILFFYPLDFGFRPHVQSPKEILIFNEKIDEFKALNCEIVACSVDSQYTHLYWIESGKKEKTFKEMNIIVLSDANHHISKAYGVYVPRWGHTLRSLFVISPKGIIQMKTIVDAPFEIDVNNVLQQLRNIEANL